MRITIYLKILLAIAFFGCSPKSKQTVTVESNDYVPVNKRKVANINTIFYIDPNKGNDSNSGIDIEAPWKTFMPVNQLILSEGNTIQILSPGDFRRSLFLIGKGSKENPITIKFVPGIYNFYPEKAYKRKFNISNTNDAPNDLKAISFFFSESENVHVQGNGAQVILRGKAMELGISHSKNITIENMAFDYYRPTVSELEVVNVTSHFADARVHQDSKYKIEGNSLVWVGEGWQHKVNSLWQAFNPNTQKVKRVSIPVEKISFSDNGKNEIRIHFDNNPGFEKGTIYQNRDTFRDYAAIFTERSKDIHWKNIKIYFMHGMGFVSQLSENIIFDRLYVGPKIHSGRTCAAWADILHFSGCKGNIMVKNSYLSAANDDAINVHGTHLRIIKALGDKKMVVRFMHPQTFGFKAFQKNDQIEFIRASSLLPYSKNRVVEVKTLNSKDIELLLEASLPNDIEPKDVIENVTCEPNVTIINNKMEYIPTRGILMTTGGKVSIAKNEFFKTNMSAILISDDANSWFESGYVRDISITNNEFVDCGSPVINIHPENSEIVNGKFVHKNIRVTNNIFDVKKGNIWFAKSTSSIQFSGNRIKSKANIKIKDLMDFDSCRDVNVENNKIIMD